MNSFLKKYSKSPIWAALLSGIVAPGLGQIYNRNNKRGILLMVISIGGLLWFSSILTEQLSLYIHTPPDTWMQNPDQLSAAITQVISKNPNMFVTFYALMLITWIFGIVDAYLSAKKPTLVPPQPDENSDTDS